jgi:energy-coupling factor transporter transmembrane protein EcfT
MQVVMRMLGRLFSNLTTHSEHIAVAMKARGFTGPREHKIALGSPQETRILPNSVAILALVGLMAGSLQF